MSHAFYLSIDRARHPVRPIPALRVGGKDRSAEPENCASIEKQYQRITHVSLSG